MDECALVQDLVQRGYIVSIEVDRTRAVVIVKLESNDVAQAEEMNSIDPGWDKWWKQDSKGHSRRIRNFPQRHNKG